MLLLLANLGRPRRPSGAAVAYAEPILPDATVASAQLAEVVDQPVAAADLADLRRLQRAAVHAAEAILVGEALDCAEINALAADSTARVELVVTEGVPRRQLVWTDTLVGCGAGPTPRRRAQRARTRPVAALRSPGVRPALLRHHTLPHTPMARRRSLRLARASTRPPAENVKLSSTRPDHRDQRAQGNLWPRWDRLSVACAGRVWSIPQGLSGIGGGMSPMFLAGLRAYRRRMRSIAYCTAYDTEQGAGR